jgi:HlyD family secretion protein
MKNFILIILSIAVITSITGCNKKSQETTVEKTSAPETEKTIEAFGLVKSEETENIYLEFPGIVIRTYISEGKSTKKGDKIIDIDIESFNKNLINKKEELDIALSELQVLKNSNETSEEELATMKAKLKDLQNKLESGDDPEYKSLTSSVNVLTAEVNNLRAELEIKRDLLSKESITKSEFQDFQNLVNSREAVLRQTEYSVEIYRQRKLDEIQSLTLNISKLEDTLSSDDSEDTTAYKKQEALVASIQKEIEKMEEMLNKNYIVLNDNAATIIITKENQLITGLQYKKGDNITASQPVFSIMSLDKLIIEANIPEEFIRDIKTGDTAVIRPLADKNLEFHGKILSISDIAQRVNNETVVLTKISIDDNDGFLIPGFNVDIEITTRKNGK